MKKSLDWSNERGVPFDLSCETQAAHITWIGDGYWLHVGLNGMAFSCRHNIG